MGEIILGRKCNAPAHCLVRGGIGGEVKVCGSRWTLAGSRQEEEGGFREACPATIIAPDHRRGERLTSILARR